MNGNWEKIAVRTKEVTGANGKDVIVMVYDMLC